MSFELWSLAILGGTLASSVYLNYRLLKHISTTKEYTEYINKDDQGEKGIYESEEEDDEENSKILDDESEYYMDIELKKRGYWDGH